jgi:fluoride exporter
VKHLILVCLGGAVGSGLRYGSDLLLTRLTPALALSFPLATLIVNWVGCFAVGIGAGVLTREGVRYGPDLKALLLVGLCGGLTTFSAFAGNTLALSPGKAMLNIGLNVAGGLMLAWLGAWLAR